MTPRGTTLALTISVNKTVKRQVACMLGDFLREASVLIAVLAPLESLITHGQLAVSGIVAIVVLALPRLLGGIALGLKR